MTPRDLVTVYKIFAGTCSFYFLGGRVISGSSETFVSVYETLRQFPEDRIINTAIT
jgi:hypothetical protein